jgi:hypothetical protein
MAQRPGDTLVVPASMGWAEPIPVRNPVGMHYCGTSNHNPDI